MAVDEGVTGQASAWEHDVRGVRERSEAQRRGSEGNSSWVGEIEASVLLGA